MSQTKDQLTDQFGKPVPHDLVLMPDPNMLNREEIDLILDQKWYECMGQLLVSAEAIDWLSEAEPEEADLDLEHDGVFHIADPLKRWNCFDGFYHA